MTGNGRLAEKHSSPAWLPISIFIGSSLAIGIPFVMFRRARAMAFKMSIENPIAAPPRRVIPSSPGSIPLSYKKSKFRTPTSPSSIQNNTKPQPSSEWDSNPSLLAALSKSTTSNALLAGKALLIATTLVGVGAYGLVSVVQRVTGAHTVPEFSQRMHYLIDKYLRGVTDRIHRPPENEEERKAAQPYNVGMFEEWSWEEAENRLEKAYEQGGFSLWAQVALRELEAEARVERTKRNRQVAAEMDSRSQSS